MTSPPASPSPDGDATGPLLLSTWSFGLRAHEAAWPALAAGGQSVDAVEQACTAAEDDPEVDSVGYGGLPDRDGVVTLDACIMLAPNRAGSVCGLHRHRHPTRVARLVMERTPHVMLSGAPADAFADAAGLAPSEVLAPEARQAWERWTRDPQAVDQSQDTVFAPQRPVDDSAGGRLFELSRETEADEEARWTHHDTIGVLARDAHGGIAGACSTSGTPFKLPGRIGDSPIIGHGLYVDPAVGGVTATGTGELIMGVCGAFLAVELMRAGRSPLDAALEVVRRVADAFTLRPEHQVALLALRADGAVAAAALRRGYRTSVTARERHEVVGPDAVLLDD